MKATGQVMVGAFLAGFRFGSFTKTNETGQMDVPKGTTR